MPLFGQYCAAVKLVASENGKHVRPLMTHDPLMLGSIIPSSFLQLIHRTSTSSLMSVPVNPHSPEDCESAPTNGQNGGCPPKFSTEATRTLAFELAHELRDGVKDLKISQSLGEDHLQTPLVQVMLQ